MRNIYLVFTMLLFFVGTSFSMDKCHSCNGNGKRQCNYCEGLGYMGNCARCEGLGMIEDKCHLCNGSGFIFYKIGNNQVIQTVCIPCNGTGSIREKCTRCIGTGHSNKCMTCLGTGMVECISCNGSVYNLHQKDTLDIQKDSIYYFGQCGMYKYRTLQDTIHVPMVVRQIDLDECTSLSLVAEDTIKPKTVGIIFASEGSLRDIAATILNPYGSDIAFSQGEKSSFFNVVKKHKVVGIAEFSWDKFELFCKLDPIRISTKSRVFDLNYDELEILSAFHQYLVDRVDEEQPPPDFVPYEVEPSVLKKAEPSYPEVALRNDIQGDVFVKVWVDRRGKVRKVVVIKSSNDIFNATAIEAAQLWEFTPAKIQGKPVSVWVPIPFRYRLKGSNQPPGK